MTDYIALGLADTGEADINDAFANMAAQTVDTFPETMLTYTNIANKASFEISKEVSDTVGVAIDVGAIPQWVDDALKSTGIDINNTETVGMLVAIGVAGASITAITNIGKVVAKVYPALRVGQLATARKMKLDAEAAALAEVE